MPKLMQDDKNYEDLKDFNIGSFQYSAQNVDELEEVGYTLVTIVLDISSSVYDFRNELLEMVKTSIRTCKNDSKVLIRLVKFNDNVKEIHGFKLIKEIDEDDYQPFYPAGMTALYDATYNSIKASANYATSLIHKDFDVNSVIFIITDGDDNSSKTNPSIIKSEKQSLSKLEEFGGLTVILIGINASNCRSSLELFVNEADLDGYKDAGEATQDNLIALAGFLSNSISTSSKALSQGQQVSLVI